MPKGVFITFEGIEGAGKSTHIQWLSNYLKETGYDPLCIREPGGTKIGEEIRHCLKYTGSDFPMQYQTELLLMNASRAQIVREKIRPALKEGRIVIADRFYDSTTAYQGYGREIDPAFVRQVIDFAVGYTRPDITFFINISPEQSESNVEARISNLPFKKDRIEASDRAFFDRVYAGFQEIARQEPKRVKVIQYMHNNMAAMQEDMIKHLLEFDLSTKK